MRQLHRYQLICDTQYTPYYYCIDKSTFEQDFMIQMEDYKCQLKNVQF